MSFSIEDKVFNFNQFIEGGADQQPRLDELNAIREKRARGEDVIVGDASCIDIVEFVVKRAGLLGHRLFGPLVEIWAEALREHVNEKADGNALAYVNPHWDHPSRLRNPDFRTTLNYEDQSEPEPEDPKDDGSLYTNGYRKPVTAEDGEKANAETERIKGEVEAGNAATEDDDEKLRRLLGE